MKKLVVATALILLPACGLKKTGQSRNVGIEIEVDGNHGATAANFQVDGGFGMRLMSFSLSLEAGPTRQPIFRDILSNAGEVEIEVPVGELRANAMMIAMPIPQGMTFEQMCANHNDNQPQSNTQSGNGGPQQGPDQGGGGHADFLFYSSALQAVNVTKDTSILQLSLPAIQRADFVESGIKIVRNNSPVQNAKVYLLEPISGKKMLEPCSGQPVEYGRRSGISQGYLYDEIPALPVMKLLVVSDGIERVFEFVPSKTDLSANLLVLDLGNGLVAAGPQLDFDGDGVSNQQEVAAQTDPMAGSVSLTVASVNGGFFATSGNSRYNAFFCKQPGSTDFFYCGKSESATAQLNGLCGSGEFKFFAAVTKDAGPNTPSTILFRSAEASVTVSAGASCSQGGSQAGGGGPGPQNPSNPVEFRYTGLGNETAGICPIQFNLFANSGVTLTQFLFKKTGTTLASTSTFSDQGMEKVAYLNVNSTSLLEFDPISAQVDYTLNGVPASFTSHYILNKSGRFNLSLWSGFVPDTHTTSAMGMQFNFDSGCKPEDFSTTASNTRFAQVVVGESHACALTSIDSSVPVDSQPRCWGLSAGHRSGQSISGDPSSFSPHDAGNINLSGGARQLSAGIDHTCAIYDSDGKVGCWGAGSHGQLGGGSAPASQAPGDPVTYSSSGNLANIALLASSGNNTCSMKNSGEISCWGEKFTNARHASFETNYANEITFTGLPATTVPAAFSIAASPGADNPFVCVITGHASDMNLVGRLFCGTINGRLNNPLVEQTYVPVGMTDSVRFKAVYGGVDTTCALTSHYTVLCATHLSSGYQMSKLGRGPSVSGTDSTLFRPVMAGPNNPLWGVGAVAVSENHACALSDQPSGRQLFCWGQNTYGQLGANSSTMPFSDYASMVVMPPPPTVTRSFEPILVQVGRKNTCVGFFRIPTSGSNEMRYECIGNKSASLVDSSTAGEKSSFNATYVAQPAIAPWAAKVRQVLQLTPSAPPPP